MSTIPQKTSRARAAVAAACAALLLASGCGAGSNASDGSSGAASDAVDAPPQAPDDSTARPADPDAGVPFDAGVPVDPVGGAVAPADPDGGTAAATAPETADAGTPSTPPPAGATAGDASGSGGTTAPGVGNGTASSGSADADAGVASQPPPTPPTTGSAGSGASTDPAYLASLTADFGYRDSLPETNQPNSTSSFGPPAASYPSLVVPSGVVDPIQWKRDRVIEVAKHYLGLPYAHKHIPSAGGLDCSNFTSWVYNYGFGVKFTSNVIDQANQAGRQLDPGEPLQTGDLLYITDSAHTSIAHVVLYIDPTHIIDSTSSATPDGVNVRAFQGWYKTRYSHARRIIE